MGSLVVNFGPKQYVWMVPDIHDEATEEEVARASQIPWLKLHLKVDKPVILIPVIPMGQPQPPLEQEEPQLPVRRPSARGACPTITIAHRRPCHGQEKN